ncbi:hypothetical protein NQ315_006911 [Exocentrus adspersus]|uniref:Fucosyltransferase n=1 Tax=Exocentrus adspersus TaxID=1586481 RepID=A0AAV8WC10_9CUCU|nr:hypothetical protein NQ315_006911 [Exocentrus adspersus]
MMRRGLFLVLSVIPCVLLIQYYYYILTPAAFKKSDVRSAQNLQIKNILYWTKMFGRKDFNLGQGSEVFQDCEVNNCYATSQKNYLPVDQFDAIVFHPNEFSWNDMDIPQNRSRDQIYIYSNQESPMNTKQRALEARGFYNWTMTYRLDSDILRPYGYYQKTTTQYKTPTVEEVKQKPHAVAWMVSHCGAYSKRDDLYRNLSKYIPIHVYGSCGDRYCPKDDFEGCYDLLAQNYKFYLSFENSICLDYVTEKLYAALMRNIVPIVYGGADYRKIAPPNSVIDVTRFNSVEELAEYIKELDGNPEKYLSYFEWKKTYVVGRSNKPTLCTLCKKLNEPIARKSYDNIDKWWVEGTCRFDNKLPKIIFT